MAAISVEDLTTGTLDGTGVFDKLMAATEAHIDSEYQKNRLKGPEYAQVYLGGMQSAMQLALQFVIEQQKVDLEAQLLAEQVTNAGKEGLLLDEQTSKTAAEISLLDAQVLNVPKEGVVLDKQACKLDAEFDLLMQQQLKATAETGLIDQKKVTESAQVSGTGVDIDSVIGRQKALYTNQAEGFLRDAEQKVGKMLLDTWNVRRTTDESGTQANTTNQLDDATIGQVMAKIRAGINA